MTNKSIGAQKERGKVLLPSLKSKKRLLFLMMAVVVLFFGLAVKMGIIVFAQGDYLRERALIQQTRDLVVSAKRGSILDRNGGVLAQSANAETVVLRPAEIKAEDIDSVAGALAQMLDMDIETVRNKVADKTKSEVWLSRQIDKKTASKIREIGLPGVHLTVDVKRFYPNGAFLTQTLGFTSVDGVGIEGIEAYYNKYLSGKNGKIISEADRDGRGIPFGEKDYIAPIDGLNVVLTIDEVIQSFLEKSIEEAYVQQNAKGTWGVAMDPMTGDILAIANYPDYDLNNPPRSDMQALIALTRNKVITDVYEPGSTFKVVTCAAALDSNAITKDSKFNCSGFEIVEGQQIKCWRYPRTHGHQTLFEAAQNSCNAAFMKMGLAMGTKTFYEYIYKFGFGNKTGITFPSDQGGIVMAEKYVRNSDLARIAFGQSIAVTPLQLISSFSAVVNGGFLFEPKLVKGIQDGEGNYIKQYQPVVVSQPISEHTSALMREILESVVEKGSGKNAYIKGFRVGGKTGTAQKYDKDGKVMTGSHIASFFGFAPADEPKIAVLIIVDEPDVAVDFGSIVAAPYVKNVIYESLLYMGVAPDYENSQAPEQVKVPDIVGKTADEAAQLLKAAGLLYLTDGTGNVKGQMPAPGVSVDKATTVLLYMSDKTQYVDMTGKVIVPDLSGLTVMQAAQLLESCKLQLCGTGKGKVVHQSPAAGEPVNEGSEVLVEFGANGQ